MKNIRLRCAGCNAKMERDLQVSELPQGYSCGRCETGAPLLGKAHFQIDDPTGCIACGHGYFYSEKDFPRPLAFTIVGIGIALSFFTYGISLIVCGVIDYLLYRGLPMMRICYRCRAEYRGYPHSEKIEAFDPHKGVAYDARQAMPQIS